MSTKALPPPDKKPAGGPPAIDKPPMGGRPGGGPGAGPPKPAPKPPMGGLPGASGPGGPPPGGGKPPLGDMPPAMDSPGLGPESGVEEASEPYGAQVLRRMHEDHQILIEEYHDMLNVLEHNDIKDFVVTHLNAIDQMMSGVEQLFASAYGENSGIPPLANAMPGGEGLPPMPMGDEEGDMQIAEDDLERDVEDELEDEEELGVEESEEPLEADSGEEEEVSADEAFEGTKKKKAMSFNVDSTAGGTLPGKDGKSKCPKCGDGGCKCEGQAPMGQSVLTGKLKPHHRQYLKEGADLFNELGSGEKPFGDGFRMKAGIYHKLFGDMTSDLVGEDGDKAFGLPDMGGFGLGNVLGGKDHEDFKLLSEASSFLKSLSEEKAFGMGHQEVSKKFYEHLSKFLKDCGDGGSDPVAEMNKANEEIKTGSSGTKSKKRKKDTVPKELQGKSLDSDLVETIYKQEKDIEVLTSQLNRLNGVFSHI